ncbi:transcriptional activator protein [Blastomyces gilchristii SLH14081]|uniref:Transcriptional activator protein n=1 Tax=Blastomyces gilchristii (strain SLH14081) TaxID=559298 RepID=A0A179U7T1_BLAGS|nr:transcriptional activator protein [Blastomyces gilchristii SLH14081]OAT04056.1 transcriptional activator protein [Blastomyces gilchristii SLH14081]
MAEESAHASANANGEVDERDHNHSLGRQQAVDLPALTSTGRAIQACDRCRFKKVRCDGTVPTCGRCKTAGLECLTTVKLNRKSYPRSYTESIEERLRQLEAEVHKLRVGNDNKDKRIKELEASGAASTPWQSTTANRPESVPKLGPRPATDEPLSREVGRMNLDRRGIGRFMGSSSGVFFIGTAEQCFANIPNHAAKKIGDSLLRVDVDDQSTEYPVLHAVDSAATLAPLPPRETAERYIDVWFDAWRHIFPILHRPSFTNSINHLYDSPSSECERSVRGIFYLMLALGCRHLFLTGDAGGGKPTVRSNQEDMEYYSHSSKYHNDILALNDLTTLQYQELQTLWFLYTGKRSLAFQMTGSMTRLALELGLHRHTRRFQFGPLETELRKRAFWVCYMLDNFVSAIHGLPKSFRDQDIDVELPSDVDDDFVNTSGYLLSLPGEPTGMLTFVSLIKVVRILSNTLEILYTTTDRRQTVTKIKMIDRLLDQWIHTLPDHLQLGPDAFTQPPLSADGVLTLIEPSIAFLHISYLYTRLSAHRVALSFFPSQPQYRTSLMICMDVAKELTFLNSRSRRCLLVFDVNPGSHVYTLWTCGLLSLFGIHGFQNENQKFELSTKSSDDAKASLSACVDLLDALVAAGRDGEKVRSDNLRYISAAFSDCQISESNTMKTDQRETWHQPPPPVLQQQLQQQSVDITHTPSSSNQSPPVPTPPAHFPQFPQHSIYGHPSPNNLPTPDTQMQNSSQPHPQPPPPHPQTDMQSPGLSRLAMSATSPSFINTFNIDFSSPFSHPYDRISDAFPPSAAPDNGTNNNQQIASGLTPPAHHQHQPHTQHSQHPHQHQHPHPHPHQRQHSMRQVWDDPVFNLPSIMHVSEAGDGGDGGNNSASFPMLDISSAEPVGLGDGGGDAGGSGARNGARKRARVGSSG